MANVDDFMRAISGQESGGDYNATNKDSGAHGRFQIMPANWPSWSAAAGIPGAPQTAENQDRVARFKMQEYYNKFGNWGDVAAAWYSGGPLNPETADRAQGGYPTIRQYVDSIMGKLGEGGTPAAGGQNVGPGEIAERPYGDPELDDRYDSYRKNYFATQDAWVKAGRPELLVYDADTDAMVPNRANPAAFAHAAAMEELGNFTDMFGMPSNRQNKTDPAQQAFENSLDLGDFELKKADAAYKRWSDRASAAEAGAQGEISTAMKQNDAAASSMDDWMANGFAGPPRSQTMHIAPTYAQAIDKWNKKLGVGEAPGMGAGVSGLQPPAPPQTGGGGGGVPGRADTSTREPGPWPFDRADSGFYGRSPFGNDNADSRFYGRNSEETGDADTGFGGAAPAQRPSPNPWIPRLNDPSLSGPRKATKDKVRKWWQKVPGFASGVQGFEGGPAMLGEREPELVEVPGFGSFMVGQNGPEERVLPPGSNVIPMSEQLMYSQIKEGARGGKQVDRMKKQEEAQMRRQDPQAMEQAMAALQKALATQMAVDPPPTPTLAPDWQGPDPWERLRPLSGVPAQAQMAAPPPKGAPQ
ncbi:MAG: hypothetical protein H0U59_10915 [Gemmatimonadaceae bacterium]|nr:hypothetical protein [Gemmatimonadaceae bacterium]